MPEEYKGIKFRVNFISKEIPDDDRIKTLIQWCRIFHNEGLTPPYEGGSNGNLSFRISEKEIPFIITGSRIGLKDDLTNEKFVKIIDCDIDKKLITAKGTLNPSSETMLHYSIYKKRPDINAIFHGHSDIILSCKEKFNFTATKTEVPYGSIELINNVLDILGNSITFFIIKNHGFVALGRTMQNAGAESMEKLERCINYS